MRLKSKGAFILIKNLLKINPIYSQLSLKSCPSAVPPPKVSFGDVLGNSTMKEIEKEEDMPNKVEL